MNDASGREATLRGRLARLRGRLVTVTLRSRSLRLLKPTAAGALDLTRVAGVDRDALVAALGREGPTAVGLCDVVPKASARDLAEDVAALSHAARAAWQETGAQELAVGWPFVEGKTDDGAWLRGPILLYPVSLEVSKTGRARWVLTSLGPPELNESLAHVLARGLGARIEARGMVGDDAERAVPGDPASLARIAALLAEAGVVLAAPEAELGFTRLEPRGQDEREAAPAGRLALRSHLVLGRFPCSDSAILLDYERILAGDIGAEALGAAARLLSVDEVEDDAAWAPVGPDLDEAIPPTEAARWRVFASDSSQDAALAHAAGLGGGADGIVVQGPPGTGKSQMIANLVAEAVAAGRRVLVVCQKRAALDVVAERLASVGLREPLAIVHDVQRDRGEVSDGVARTLQDLDGASAAGLDDLERATLDDEREHALHAGRAAARLVAAEEAFAAVAGTPGGPPGLARLFERAAADDGRPLPDLRARIAGLTEAQATADLPRIESLCRQTAPFAPPHPLAARTDWSRHAPASLAAVLDRLRGLRARIDALAAAPRGALRAGQARAAGALWARTAVLLDVFEAGDEAVIKAFLLSWAWAGGDAEHGAWREVTALLRGAQATFEPAPGELVRMRGDTLRQHVASLARLEALGARWYRGVTPEYWRLKSLPAAILAACPSLDVAELGATEARRLCEAALRWQGLIADLPAADHFWDLGLGGALEDLDHALDRLREEHARIAAVHDLFAALHGHGGPYFSREGLAESLAERGAAAPFFAAAVADRAQARRLDAVHEALVVLRGDLAEELCAHLADACARDDFPAALARVDALLGAEAQVPAVAQVDRLLAATAPWVRAFLRGYRPPEGADPGRDALLALDRAWVRAALGDRSLGVVEEPLVDEAQLLRLSDDLEACRRLAGHGVLARYRQRLRAEARDPRRGVGLRKLAAEAGRKRSRPTLRQLVERHWATGLSLARPVWLCSPEAVSALFPLSPELFDVVVVDEASQCPVEAGLPALTRARRAIVAGDDQQMPPAHFFRASVDAADDEEEESVLASASLLGLARVALPGLVLRWHYRSKHEELIAFSNAAFYGGRLVTAPRAGARDAPFEGLHWDRVEGLWIEQENPLEAERVVQVVASLLAHPGPAGAPSVGVVAFNRKQAERIERALDARAAADDAFRGCLERDRARPAIEQLFVRNLENVQGDERDVIVVSTGYAPTAPGGRVQARFGPVGTEGGERRLNVAITRARVGLHVVSSIEPGELDVSGTKHVGPKLLKAYLAFVRAHAHAHRDGRRADPEVARLLALAAELGGARGVTAGARAPDRRRPASETAIEALESALRSRGLRTQRDVGLGPRRIDLAVGLPDEDRFRAGVDCTQFLHDGAALSRDVYTPRFWRRLGWRVVRVTPGRWHTRPDEVVAAVLALLTGL